MSHDNFELPTVASLNRRITELTHERDHLAAKLAHAPTDMDHAAVCAERDDLRQKLVALDRARLTLAATAHGLLGALDEGDLDTPAYVERMREALTALATDNIRMTLTDKGIEAVTAGPVTRVAQETEPETDSRSTPTEQAGKHHNGQYGVPVDDHGSHGLADVNKTSPITASVSDVGETTLLPLDASHFMMATRAHHSFAGDISRNVPSLAVIYGEVGDVWIGEWVTGLGYVNVRFPKQTTRPLTPEEVALYDGRYVHAGNGGYKIRITEENPR